MLTTPLVGHRPYRNPKLARDVVQYIGASRSRKPDDARHLVLAKNTPIVVDGIEIIVARLGDGDNGRDWLLYGPPTRTRCRIVDISKVVMEIFDTVEHAPEWP